MTEEHVDRDRPIDHLVLPFQQLARHKLTGVVLLLTAALVAMIWANSPWRGGYFLILETKFTIGYGKAKLSKPLLLWINDGLMGIFFFVVGLEIKREVLVGDLSTWKGASLPIFAAVGGMVVPALVYALINLGSGDQRGWGIPMATDIAFALGLLALLGERVPISLKIFLTALAIVDDLGAILVIALFYSEQISLVALGIGAVGLGLALAANRTGVRNSIVYLLLGLIVWVAFLKSGVHATLAAVLMAFAIPARVPWDPANLSQRVSGLLGSLESEHGDPLREKDLLHTLMRIEEEVLWATPPLSDIEHHLMPWVTFLVLPVFALANAGVPLGGAVSGALTSPIFWGVLLGLFLGKQAGIFAGAWLAVRGGFAELPPNTSWRQIYGVGLLGGIGFTMSLFIASLAFSDPSDLDTARLGIIVGSLISAVAGVALLNWQPDSAPGPETE